MSYHLPKLGDDPQAPFPDAETALRRPDGLLAFGGDLSPPRLLNAYANGIFPWFSAGQPILWWSPDPRTLFRTDSVRLSSRFRRDLRHASRMSSWVIRADTTFEAVIRACASVPRRGQDGTWITGEMLAAYAELHRLGHAHSIEVFDGVRLVGGLYGVAVGRMFFGESMYSGESGGSKLALAGLARRLAAWGWPLIDAQVGSSHLFSLGAESWPRSDFLVRVHELVSIPASPGGWTARFGALPVSDLA